MRFYLHYPNLQSFKESYEKLFDTKSLSDVKKYLRALEYETEKVSFQYVLQYEAINEMRKVYGDNANFEGLLHGFYFGNDTCEHLIPSLEEFKEFDEEVHKVNRNPDSPRKKTITFVTPPVGNFGIKKLRPILEFMNEKGNKGNEVVINDYGTLNLIQEEYKNLTPVLGRLFNKAQRNPVLGDQAHPQIPAQLGKKIFDKIRKNQQDYYHSNPLDLDVFKDSFRNVCGINRFGVDHVGFGIGEEMQKEIALDLYYPFAMVTCGRNCATRGIQEKTGEWYVQDAPCPRYCRSYDVFLEDGMHDKQITQRGNAVWMTYASFEGIEKSVMENKENRLVYQPFIPV